MIDLWNVNKLTVAHTKMERDTRNDEVGIIKPSGGKCMEDQY